MANMTQVPVYVPPVTQEAPNNQPVPSNPNPYLNQTVYPPLDSYFVPPPNYHYTPWIGGWYNYQVPIIQQGVVFWTGSVTVIVQ